MFESAILSSGPQTKRVWSTIFGFGGQAVIVLCLVLAPLVWPQTIPRVAWAVSLAPPSPPPPPPPPPPVTHVVPRGTVAPVRQFDGTRLITPINVPEHVAHIVEAEVPSVTAGVQGGIPGSAMEGVSGSVLDILNGAGRTVAPRPPVRPPTETRTAEAVRPQRITQLQMAEPIQRVPPLYPAIARAARISGKVELLGVLGVDGRIHEVRVVSGHPLLVKAAVDAVVQWVYRPTILNGQPVEVQAPIIVNFILN